MSEGAGWRGGAEFAEQAGPGAAMPAREPSGGWAAEVAELRGRLNWMSACLAEVPGRLAELEPCVGAVAELREQVALLVRAVGPCAPEVLGDCSDGGGALWSQRVAEDLVAGRIRGAFGTLSGGLERVDGRAGRLGVGLTHVVGRLELLEACCEGLARSVKRQELREAARREYGARRREVGAGWDAAQANLTALMADVAAAHEAGMLRLREAFAAGGEAAAYALEPEVSAEVAARQNLAVLGKQELDAAGVELGRCEDWLFERLAALAEED